LPYLCFAAVSSAKRLLVKMKVEAFTSHMGEVSLCAAVVAVETGVTPERWGHFPLREPKVPL
jgi:hypothetical protein